MKHSHNCASCSEINLQTDLIKLSNKDFGVSLCRPCQVKYQRELSKSVHNANRLFFSLKARQIEATLAHNDGKKTIDIVVEKSRLHIEVDGDQHNIDAEQALKDLMRTYYAFKDGYFTLRIPNSLVKTHIKEALKFIIYIIDLLDKRNNEGISRRA